MIKIVIFDADGMVINKPKRFSANFAEEYKISIEKINAFFEKEWPAIIVGSADLKERLAEYLPGWGWQGSVEELLEYWFRSEHYIDQRLVDSIYALKEKSILCFLATDQEKYRLGYLKSEMGFAQLFDKIFSSAELGYTKHDYEFWRVVASQIGISSENILFWDDERENLSEAAKLGIKTEFYSGYDGYQKTMREYNLLQ